MANTKYKSTHVPSNAIPRQLTNLVRTGQPQSTHGCHFSMGCGETRKFQGRQDPSAFDDPVAMWSFSDEVCQNFILSSTGQSELPLSILQSYQSQRQCLEQSTSLRGLDSIFDYRSTTINRASLMVATNRRQHSRPNCWSFLQPKVEFLSTDFEPEPRGTKCLVSGRWSTKGNFLTRIDSTQLRWHRSLRISSTATRLPAHRQMLEIDSFLPY